MPRARRAEDTPTPPTTEQVAQKVCLKCVGTIIFGPKHHASQLSCSRWSRFRKIARKEHLHFTCQCGYDWIEPVSGDTIDGLVANTTAG